MTLKVDGMVCEGCSGRVEETLQKMAGVKKVRAPLGWLRRPSCWPTQAAGLRARMLCGAQAGRSLPAAQGWPPAVCAATMPQPEPAGSRSLPWAVPTPPADLPPSCPKPPNPQVHVDLEKGIATVAVEAGAAPDAASAAKPLADAVRELGFEAEPQLAA